MQKLFEFGTILIVTYVPSQYALGRILFALGREKINSYDFSPIENQSQKRRFAVGKI